MTLALVGLVTPLDPLHGDGYNFWSGIGSGSPVFVFLAVWWRRHNCHVRRCPLLQWKHTEAGDIVCRIHHPESAKTAKQVHDDHHRAKDLRLARLLGDA